MIQLNERSALSGFLFLFTALLLYKTIGMRADVALVPRIAGFIMLLFTGIQLCNDLFTAVQKRFPGLNNIKNEDDFSDGAPEKDRNVDEPLIRTVQEAKDVHDIQDVQEIQESADMESKEAMKSRYIMIVWLIFFIVLIYFTSMIWALTISLFIYLKWISKERWLLSILYPIISAVLTYVVFVIGFDLRFFF
jgi:hypothetical protein